MANVLPREKQLQVLHLLVEGSSIRACERVTGKVALTVKGRVSLTILHNPDSPFDSQC